MEEYFKNIPKEYVDKESVQYLQYNSFKVPDMIEKKTEPKKSYGFTSASRPSHFPTKQTKLPGPGSYEIGAKLKPKKNAYTYYDCYHGHKEPKLYDISQQVFTIQGVTKPAQAPVQVRAYNLDYDKLKKRVYFPPTRKV